MYNVHINNTFQQNNNKYFHLFLRCQCLQGFQDVKKYLINDINLKTLQNIRL